LKQPPQFIGSPLRSAHDAPQAVSGAAHVHAPAWQDCPPVHAVPHEPQFALSV
jgi:hypothetical protein